MGDTDNGATVSGAAVDGATKAAAERAANARESPAQSGVVQADPRRERGASEPALSESDRSQWLLVQRGTDTEVAEFDPESGFSMRPSAFPDVTIEALPSTADDTASPDQVELSVSTSSGASRQVSLLLGQVADVDGVKLTWVPARVHRDQHPRLLPHGDFLVQADQAVALAYRSGQPLSVAVLVLRSGRQPDAALSALDTLRKCDVRGSLAERHVEILMPGTNMVQAQAALRRVMESRSIVAFGVCEVPKDAESATVAVDKALQSLHAQPDGERYDAPFIATESGFSAVVEQVEGALTEGSARLLLSGEQGSGRTHLAVAALRKAYPGVTIEFITYTSLSAGDLPLLGGDAVACVVRDVDRFEAQQLEALESALASFSTRGRWVLTSSLRTETLLRRVGAGYPQVAALLHKVNAIDVPPLRRRAVDVVPLAMEVLQSEVGGDAELNLAAMAKLVASPWPGNVAELRHVLRRACLQSDGAVIRPEHLSDAFSSTPMSDSDAALRSHVDNLERTTIERAMAEHGQNQTHAARALGISRRALIYKLEKYGLKAPPGEARAKRRA